ncbi:MAG: PAS domain-containing protein, partial [Oscillospiraceae bacterium]
HTAVEVVAEKGDNHTLPKMKFQNIINSIPGGIAIYKVSSVFETVFFSDGVPALTGYSVEEYRELIKCDAAEMTYYEDTEMVKEKIRYALENNTIADFTFRKSHRNGNIVWVRVQGVKIGEQEGFPLLQCIFYNITAEVQSNYKIAEIYNNIPGAIYRCKYNDDWEVIDANDGFFDFLGYSREEFANMGNKLSKVIFPHDMAGVMEKVSAQLVGGNVKIESENRLVCKNGTVKWISLKGQLFFDESGGKCFYCVFIDITYQKKISQQLEIRRSSIEAAINHSNLHYWEYDLGENSAYLSQKSMDDYNFPKVQENFPQSWFDAGKMYAEDIKIYSDAIEKIKNGEKEVQFEVRVLNPESNEYSWKHIIYTNVFNEEGIPIKAIATGEDIDAYKDLESRFTYVMGQNGIYTWEYNIKNATIHLFNNAEFGKFENHSIEFMPKSIIDDGKVHPDGIEDILDMYEKIDRGEKSASCKVQLKLGNKNKWVWYKIDYAIIFDRDQKPIRAIGCASNITQQVEAKHKYQELVALQELTEQKSVGSFTINISKNEVMNCRSQAPEFLAFSNMTVDGFFSASRGLVIGEKSREVYDSLFLRDKLFQMFSQGIREKSVEVFYSLGVGRERWLKMFITLTKNPTTGD